MNPAPDARSIVGGTMTLGEDERRRRQNQVAAERNGHVQSVPMTSAGLAQLQLLRDVLSRSMAENKVPIGLRQEVMAASPALTLQGQQTRLEIAVARPDIQQALARLESEEVDRQAPADSGNAG